MYYIYIYIGCILYILTYIHSFFHMCTDIIYIYIDFMCICMCASVNPFSFLYSLNARFDRSTIYRLGQNMGVIILQGHMYVSACVSEITRASEILHAHTHLHTHTHRTTYGYTHTHIHANATSTRKFMRTSQNFAVHCSAQYLS